MIIQHLLLFVFLAFCIGRKPKSNQRARSRSFNASYRTPAKRTAGSDSLLTAKRDTVYFLSRQ
jgi:hypothetical protein